MYKLKKFLFIFFLGIFYLFLNANLVSAESNSDKVIKDIKDLEILAENYLKENQDIDYNVNQLVISYITNNSYDDNWKSLGIKKDENFEIYVKNNKDFSYLQDTFIFENIDFKLFINSLNVLIKEKSNYCNWGYLVVNEIIFSKNIDKNKDIDKIINELTYNQDITKINAVMDSCNISKILNTKYLSEALTNYYSSINDDVRVKNFVNNYFPSLVITKQNLRDSFYNEFISDVVIIRVLNNNGILLSDNENLLKAVNYKFADFIYKKHPDITNSSEKILPTEIRVKEFPDYLNIGDEFELEIIFIPENVSNKNYVITTDNNDVIKIDNNKIIALKDGECSIFIKTEHLELKKDLKVYGKPSFIFSDKTDYSITVDEEINLSYKFDVLSNEDVEWIYDNSFVFIDSNGNLKPISAGSTEVYCKLKSNPNISLKYNIFIESPVDLLFILNRENTKKYEDTVVLNNKEIYFLDINVQPFNQKEHLSYKSSNEKVCTIKDGAITAKNPGETTITVYSSFDKNKKDSIKVIVLPPIEKATFSEDEIYINLATQKGKEFKVSVNFYPEEVDTNLLDFYVYKIDEKGNKKRDFSAISYDYKNGILTGDKIGNYKVSCINRETFEEVGFFTVVIEYIENDVEKEEIVETDHKEYFESKLYNLVKIVILFVVGVSLIGIISTLISFKNKTDE